MHWAVEATLIFAVLLALIFAGVPIAFSLAAVGIGGMIMEQGYDTAAGMLGSTVYNSLNNYLFVALPLFILMGSIATEGGVGKRIIDAVYKSMGQLPGSLAIVSVGACTIFAAVCGTSVAGAASVGSLIIPETVDRGYSRSFISGTIAAGSGLGILIPPSLMLIMYAIITEESVSKLFMAGIIPGIIVSVSFCTYIIIRVARNPSLAPPPTQIIPWKERILVMWKTWPALLLIVIVLGGIYGGIATPTEVSAIGCVTAFLIALAYRDLKFIDIIKAIQRVAGTVAFFILIYIGATLLMRLLSYMEVPQNLANFITDQGLSMIQLVIVMQVVFFVLGCFLDPTSAMLIILPVCANTLRVMEVDFVWLGIITTLSIMIANMTPPVGFSLFVIKGIAQPFGVTFGDIVRGVIPYILILFAVIALIMVFPSLATWLPDTL